MRLPRKSDARSYEVLHLSCKPEDQRLTNATLLRKSAPGPPNSSDEHVSCTCFAPQRRALFRHLNFQKVLGEWCALYFLTSECASRIVAPQRRALFRHLNFQKWSEHGVFCTFWLGHVLRATTACNFSSLIWPAGSAPAALVRLLFDPPEPQIIGKTQCFATFLPFRAPASSDSFASLIFSLLLFSSLLWLLPPLLFICPYCRKFDFYTSFNHIDGI